MAREACVRGGQQAQGTPTAVVRVVGWESCVGFVVVAPSRLWNMHAHRTSRRAVSMAWLWPARASKPSSACCGVGGAVRSSTRHERDTASASSAIATRERRCRAVGSV